MITKKNEFISGGLLQFSPYIVFLATYISLYYYTIHTKNTYHSNGIIITKLPLIAAFIAVIYACFTYKESLNINKKIEIFFSGVADIHAVNSYFNIICITIFNYMLAKTNGVLIAVTLSLLYIQTSWIMPFLFLLVSILSIIIPSLPAVIIIFMPISYGIAQSLQINCAFMAATIISGALLGSHLSLYLNNFQLSKPINFSKNLYKNLFLIIAAMTITLCILSQYQCTELINTTMYANLKTTLTIKNYITIIPYFSLLLGSFLQIPLIVNLIIGSCIACITEIMLHNVLFLDVITTPFHGFYKETLIINILLLHMLIAGLTKIIKYNGGFSYIIYQLKLKNDQNPSSSQFSIILITIITNILVIIDSLCLNLIKHPIKNICDINQIAYNKIAHLVHITTTIIQVFLPYTLIMMITINITHVSYIEILQYMIYPLLIIIFTLISLFI